ncbi:hypothetical protein PSEUBRA_002161 [Kalmanozyma brasiliensis GHG001]|uniref:uncharacterized protein n=1 Tax=Kalmanozyma brasiliensis (strain GHG001) TaxID=1365824 RepID=UPI001CEB4E6C|nr:uncharacterized protein PSEUBRA_002161 [Kalmanozyma brasiliensis GHG001]KAF6767046.1 hypothetical protein PSEUBRA_002161 [Kalmanozyma brasiliensis GHG001]
MPYHLVIKITSVHDANDTGLLAAWFSWHYIYRDRMQLATAFHVAETRLEVLEVLLKAGTVDGQVTLVRAEEFRRLAEAAAESRDGNVGRVRGRVLYVFQLKQDMRDESEPDMLAADDEEDDFDVAMADEMSDTDDDDDDDGDVDVDDDISIDSDILIRRAPTGEVEDKSSTQTVLDAKSLDEITLAIYEENGWAKSSSHGALI